MSGTRSIRSWIGSVSAQERDFGGEAAVLNSLDDKFNELIEKSFQFM